MTNGKGSPTVVILTSMDTELPERRKTEFADQLREAQSRLFGYIHSLVRDLDDADDLFQQTTLILWNKFGDFDPARSFLSWACGVARLEVWGPQPQGPYLPLVHASFDRRPLEEGLRELAEQSGFNVLLDARAGEKGKLAVSGQLLNAPLDTAVRFLADMADLRAVTRDNVIYVTTPENAGNLQERLKKEAGACDPAAEAAPPRVGYGPRGNSPAHRQGSPGAM